MKALRQAEQQSQAIIPASKAPITLPFDPSVLAGQLRPSSIALYRRDMRAYLTYAETAGLDPWQAATFSRWRTRLAQETELSPHTINRMLSAVKRLLREGAEQGYFSHELASTFQDRKGVQVRALKERLKPHARTRISPEDMRRLCNAPDRATLKGLRDTALLHTLASSGTRVSEAAPLTIEQVVTKQNNGKAGYLLLVRGKTDEEPREAPLSPEAYTAILAGAVPHHLLVLVPGPLRTWRTLAGAAHDLGGCLADGAALCQPVSALRDQPP